MKITFLGVWMASDVGETVSFVIDTNDGARILVDCGTNLVKGLLDAGIDPMSITHIIVTHSHGDHISGLPGYLFYRYLFAPVIYKKENKPFTIISSESCIESIKTYIGVPYPTLVNPKGLEYKIAELDKDIKIGKNTISFFQSKHKPMTFGFIFKGISATFVYSGDTAFDEKILSYARNCDCLVHDVAATDDYPALAGGHTLCQQISPCLNKYGIKKFIPVHRISIYKSNIKPYLDALKKDYCGEVIIPEDGMFVEL